MRKLFLCALLVLVMSVFALPAFAAPEYTIKVGTIVSETHSDMISMKKVFVPYIEGESKGRIKVELYPNGQLGGDREMSESVQMGVIQMALPDVAVLAGFDKRFQIIGMPYLFKDRETAFEALDGELGQKLNETLLPKGMMGLGYMESGMRHVTNSKLEVLSPADIKGMKIRTMENPMHIAYFKLLGANPTPMSWGELYTALQQGTVDGEENPLAMVWDGKFYEVQKYLSTTGHVFSATILLTNKKFIDNLPEDLRKIVLEGAHRFALEDRVTIAAMEKDFEKQLKEKGMQITVLTPEQKKPFIDAANPLYDQFEKDIGKEIMDIAKKFRK